MSKTSRRVVIGTTLAGAGALVLIGVLVFTLAIAPQQREAAFLDTYAEHPGHLDGLSDSQLLVTFQGNCEEIADGRTLDEELSTARDNWMEDVAEITFSEYLDNVTALWESSEEAC